MKYIAILLQKHKFTKLHITTINHLFNEIIAELVINYVDMENTQRKIQWNLRINWKFEK